MTTDRKTGRSGEAPGPGAQRPGASARPSAPSLPEGTGPGTSSRSAWWAPAPARGGEAPGGSAASMDALIPKVELPKGGGALSGLDEKVAHQAFSGSASYRIELPLPAARGGPAPAGALRYDSGNGNGLCGIGWSLDLPAITRKTSDGLPRYQGDTEPDTFVLAGAEDLVPAMVEASPGTWVPDTRTEGDWDIVRYRPRVEGAWTRVERWRHRTSGEVHWRTRSRDDVLSVFGFDPEHRIADPLRPSRVFTWLLQSQVDGRGNAIAWEYKAEDDAGAPAIASERNRSDAARHVKRIFWGPTAPQTDPVGFFPLDPADWLFEVVFDYGEHGTSPPLRTESAPWIHRPDPVSNFRAGFEVRTRRLLRQVLLFHRFAELGTDSTLVRSLLLSYDAASPSDPPESQGNPYGSRLVRAQHLGWLRTSPTAQTYTSSARPPTTFEYTELRPPGRTRSFEVDGGERPSALHDGRHRLVDLDGEGLPGLLRTDTDAWSYRRNLGGGRFSAARPLPTRPVLAELRSGRRQLSAVTGSGRVALVQWGPQTPGFHERTAEGGWASFRPFRRLPNLDFSDPHLRWVDLDGDGRPDLLLAEDHVFRWYPFLGEEGFDDERRAPVLPEEEDGPRVVFWDKSQAVLFADMSGDGLQDLVRVRQGSVCYWPNLGHGRFGARIDMAGAPFLGGDGAFVPARVRLADVDGTGPADLLYLGERATRLWRNQSGSGFAPDPIALYTLPLAVDPATVELADVLGNGTLCLVWPDLAPRGAGRLHYQPLVAPLPDGTDPKPNLLRSVKNGFGLETSIQWTPSTKFYLEARAAGRPWATRLSFPVQVASRIETWERITDARLVRTFEYHHGTWDPVEREFRGFGKVESRDAESFAQDADPAIRDDRPPVRTVSWYHTGAFFERGGLSAALAGEYWAGDPQAPRLSGPVLPAGLSPPERREAHRALKGSPLRVEIYAEDGGASAGLPYAVTESSQTLIRVQPRDASGHGVFLVVPRETRTASYERNPSGTADPRVVHELVLQTDAFGNVLRKASVAYARRSSAGLPEQDGSKVVVTGTGFINVADEPGWQRIGVPWRTTSYEITRPPPSTGQPGKDDRTPFDLPTLAAEVETALGAPLGWDEAPGFTSVEARRLTLSVTVFRADDQSTITPLPLGELESLALPYRQLAMTLPGGLKDTVFGSSVDEADLEEGGYRTSLSWLEDVYGTGGVPSSAWTELRLDATGNESDAWARSGQATYALAAFYLPIAATDPFGNATTVAYDGYDLLPTDVEDAVGNAVAADYAITGNDSGYRVLKPVRITDPNGNRTEVAYDGLGAVVQIAYQGKASESLGDSIDLSDLDAPTAGWDYDLFNWLNNGKPAWVHARHRQEHGGTPTWEEARSYFDGLGRVVCTKQKVEPGLAPEQDADGSLVNDPPTFAQADPRYVGSGRVVFDNKGAPVRQYEPYFSSVLAYEDEGPFVEWGVSPVLRYDPLGRPVRVEHPDGSFETTSWDPWRQVLSDRNDNCRTWDGSAWVDSDWYAAMSTSSVPEEVRAGKQALACVNTPTVAHLDVLGRPVRSVANASQRWPSWWSATPPSFSYTPATSDDPADLHVTRTVLDIVGNAVEVWDPRMMERERTSDPLGWNAIQTQVFDMAGQALRTDSADGGWRKALLAVDGQPLRAFDERGHQRRWSYDAARRPTHAYVTPPGGSEEVHQRIVFGEGAMDAADHNLRGQVHSVYDGAGLVRTADYDFRGRAASSVRRCAADFEGTPDWSGLSSSADPAAVESSASSLLEAEEHETALQYDALSRPTSVTSPDGNATLRTWNVGGLLETVSVLFDGDSTPTPKIAAIDYDAHGRRTRVELQPGTETTYEYHPTTMRLAHLLTTKSVAAGGTVLQDFSYWHDAAGNLVEITDDANPTVYFDNTAVTTERRYVYDALYRLAEATGREHVSLTSAPDDGSMAWLGLPDSTQTEALRRYTESYSYDRAGNLLETDHDGGSSGSWTRTQSHADDSNRLDVVTVGSSSDSYPHDVHGNVTAMPHMPTTTSGDDIQGMLWDAADRLQRTRHGTGAGTYFVYYQYGADGRRVRKVRVRPDGSRYKETLYVGEWERFREYQGDGSTVEEAEESLHLSDDRKRFAILEVKTVEAGGPVGSPSYVTRYQLGDHLGSSNVEIGDSEELLTFEEYHPYGTTSHRGQSASNPGWSRKRYRFTGQERDEESGLGYHWHRYYAPWLGRWTSADPAGLSDGVNRYAYAGNAPTSTLDSSGLQGSSDIDEVDDKRAVEQINARHSIENLEEHYAEYYGGKADEAAALPEQYRDYTAREGDVISQLDDRGHFWVQRGDQSHVYLVTSSREGGVPAENEILHAEYDRVIGRAERLLEETDRLGPLAMAVMIPGADDLVFGIGTVVLQGGKWLRIAEAGGGMRARPPRGYVPPGGGREATGFLGVRGRLELANAPYQVTRNVDAVIRGRTYAGHALDQMQNRGLVPSVVEHTIRTGTRGPDPISGRFRYYDSTNNVTVILDAADRGKVVTAIPGRLR